MRCPYKAAEVELVWWVMVISRSNEKSLSHEVMGKLLVHKFKKVGFEL